MYCARPAAILTPAMTFSPNTAPSTASSARRALVAAAATAIGLIGLLSAAQPAFAATIPVDTPVDDITVNGNCTLREAVQAANTDSAVDACVAGAGEDVISLPSGVIRSRSPAQTKTSTRPAIWTLPTRWSSAA